MTPDNQWQILPAQCCWVVILALFTLNQWIFWHIHVSYITENNTNVWKLASINRWRFLWLVTRGLGSQPPKSSRQRCPEGICKEMKFPARFSRIRGFKQGKGFLLEGYNPSSLAAWVPQTLVKGVLQILVDGLTDVQYMLHGPRNDFVAGWAAANYTKHISIQNVHYIRGSRAELQLTNDLEHFSLKIWHFVATNFIIFTHGQGQWRDWRLI